MKEPLSLWQMEMTHKDKELILDALAFSEKSMPEFKQMKQGLMASLRAEPPTFNAFFLGGLIIFCVSFNVPVSMSLRLRMLQTIPPVGPCERLVDMVKAWIARA